MQSQSEGRVFGRAVFPQLSLCNKEINQKREKETTAFQSVFIDFSDGSNNLKDLS